MPNGKNDSTFANVADLLLHFNYSSMELIQFFCNSLGIIWGQRYKTLPFPINGKCFKFRKRSFRLREYQKGSMGLWPITSLKNWTSWNNDLAVDWHESVFASIAEKLLFHRYDEVLVPGANKFKLIFNFPFLWNWLNRASADVRCLTKSR